MSTFMWNLLYARNAGANLLANLHYIAKIDTDGDIVLCGDGQPAIGVISESAIENSPVTVQMDGIAKILLASTITPGQLVASDSGGKGALATTGEYIVGIALGGGLVNEIISVALVRGGRAA